MTDHVDTWPTARKRHWCEVCGRAILPGETYWRQAALDGGIAWTNKTCSHCESVMAHYACICGTYPDEWETECLWGWLGEVYPAVMASAQAGWSYPDGELVPLPFGSSCLTCDTRIESWHLWCDPCNTARIERINQQLLELADTPPLPSRPSRQDGLLHTHH